MTVKHGAYLWLKEKKVHPSIRGHEKLQKYLNDLERDLIKDLGGPEQLTAAKEILIKTVIEAYGFVLLSSMYCKKEGIINPILFKKGIVSLQPVLSNQFIAFMNSCRQSLIALGLDRKKADEILPPWELAARIEQEDKERERKEKNGKSK